MKLLSIITSVALLTGACALCALPLAAAFAALGPAIAPILVVAAIAASQRAS